MYEPLAASIIRRLTTEVAASALPDAPVRAQPVQATPPKPAVAPYLRRRSATLLIGLAGRLDPGLRTANSPGC